MTSKIKGSLRYKTEPMMPSEPKNGQDYGKEEKCGNNPQLK